MCGQRYNVNLVTVRAKGLRSIRGKGDRSRPSVVVCCLHLWIVYSGHRSLVNKRVIDRKATRGAVRKRDCDSYWVALHRGEIDVNGIDSH